MGNLKKSAKLTGEIVQWVRENGLIEYGGASIEMLARQFGISRKTHTAWMKSDADYAEAINEAKSYFSEHLERDLVLTLAKAAKGYPSKKSRTEEAKNKQGEVVGSKKIVEEVDVKPDIGAAIFLLTNIAPERWKNKLTQSADIKGDFSLGVVIQDNTPEIVTNEADIID